jgi:hypothetical protein
MGANLGTQEKRRYFKLIAKAEKAEPNGYKVIVEVVKKGDKYEQGEWFKSLSGYIIKAEIKEFEFEKAMKKKCILEIMDADEICQLEFTFNFATYGLINALMNTDFTKKVDIKGWIGQNGFVGAGISYDGENDLINWALSLENTPKGISYQTPAGETKTDYANVSKFWEQNFKDKVCVNAKRSNYKMGTVLQEKSIAEKKQEIMDRNDHIPDNLPEGSDDLIF